MYTTGLLMMFPIKYLVHILNKTKTNRSGNIKQCLVAWDVYIVFNNQPFAFSSTLQNWVVTDYMCLATIKCGYTACGQNISGKATTIVN